MDFVSYLAVNEHMFRKHVEIVNRWLWVGEC